MSSQYRLCSTAIASAEDLGAVRGDIVAALERRAQLAGELAHLEAGVGEARDALARTRAQVCGYPIDDLPSALELVSRPQPYSTKLLAGTSSHFNHTGLS